MLQRLLLVYSWHKSPVFYTSNDILAIWGMFRLRANLLITGRNENQPQTKQNEGISPTATPHHGGAAVGGGRGGEIRRGNKTEKQKLNG